MSTPVDRWTAGNFLDAGVGTVQAYGKSPVDGKTRVLDLTSRAYLEALDSAGWTINVFWIK